MSEQRRVGEITADDFAHWKHHPVSKLILKFLRDRSSAIEAEIVARWRLKSASLNEEEEARGRILELDGLADLSFDDLFEFYKTDEDEHEEANAEAPKEQG